MILLLATLLAAPDLRLELQRESLTGTHYRYRQYIEGIPVAGGEVTVTVRHDGTREERRRLALPPSAPRLRAATADADLTWLNVDGVAQLARREVVHVDGFLPVVRYRDLETGRIIDEQPLYASAKHGAVFDPNPVVKLNEPELRDLDDSPVAVPPAAYSIEELRDLRPAGPLGGPSVQIAELQAPSVPPVDGSQDLVFDRADSGFEDVNAYFHIDRSQRHLQSLGYRGPRALVPYAIETDTHSVGGRDDSFFVGASSGVARGRLHFGEGGTDDAEDSDLLLHEYAHAIHDWISPGTFLAPARTAARAVSEGFGDYWALSAKYAAAMASGRDPFCFADWDARCWEDSGSEQCAYPPGSDCLRRLDTGKTMADFVESNEPGTEHRNGQIWSAALAEIFVALTARYGLEEGRHLADMLVIESFFGTPPNPTFATMARQMIGAEQFLTGGANRDVICAAMQRRGILDDCIIVPRDDITLFPGRGSGVVVPDNDPAGVVLSAFVNDPRLIERLMVRVDIRHRGRGELRVVLIAPDGTTVRLSDTSADRSPDLITTFGRESAPIDSLDVFRGRPAAGEWRLRVSDVAPADVATVISWALAIDFAGDEPASARPAAPGIRQFIPVAGHAPGANGTFFRTDLQLLNPRSSSTEALLIFTPSAADGRTQFAAVRVVLGPDESVTFSDVVRTLFVSGGLGQIEIAGDVIASSRTWTGGEQGTFGLFAAAMDPAEAIGANAVAVDLTHLAPSDGFRTNIGFAEVTGAPATVTVTFFAGDTILHRMFQVPAWGHIQERLDDGTRIIVSVAREAKVLVYGAIVDNRSGDPILVPVRRDSRTAGRIPAISSAGAAGTFWRTSLRLTHPAVMSYAAPEGVLTRVVNPLPLLHDVVATLFEKPGTMGTLIADSSSEIVARVWTAGLEGTYGLYAPFRQPSPAPVQHILHVENSEAFRTNFGLLSDIQSRVRLTVLSGDGGVVSLSEHVVLPDVAMQFPLIEPVVNGRARIDVLEGRVYAYAAVVDNRSGDPIFVPAVAP